MTTNHSLSQWPTAQQPPREQAAELQYLPFSAYFPHTPTALCIRECIRLTKIEHYPRQAPILDVGCGDGLFARLAFRSDKVWGVDIDAKEGRWAQASKAYSQIIIGDIAGSVLPEAFFRTCVANCSLEHIPDLPGALATIYRALTPGGLAYLFVPARDWAEALRSVRLARRLGASWLADTIRSGIDGVFRHYHLYEEEEWVRLCLQAGFEVLEVSPLGTVAATQAFEAFLPSSLLGLATKKLTGRWTLSPAARKLMALPAYALVQLAFRATHDTSRCAEYFIALRKPAQDDKS